MSSRARTLIIVFSLFSLLVAGSAEAKKKKPGPPARQKADARVFYNASLTYRNGMANAGGTIDAEIDAALALCPTSLEGATPEQVTALKEEIGYFLFLREAVVIHKAYANKITARKSKNASLRQIAAAARKINAEFNKLAAITVDGCAVAEAWKMAAWDADFLDDWFSDQLDAASFDLLGYAGLLATLPQTRPKLVVLGLTKAQATAVINAALFS